MVQYRPLLDGEWYNNLVEGKKEKKKQQHVYDNMLTLSIRAIAVFIFYPITLYFSPVWNSLRVRLYLDLKTQTHLNPCISCTS